MERLRDIKETGIGLYSFEVTFLGQKTGVRVLSCFRVAVEDTLKGPGLGRPKFFRAGLPRMPRG